MRWRLRIWRQKCGTSPNFSKLSTVFSVLIQQNKLNESSEPACSLEIYYYSFFIANRCQSTSKNDHLLTDTTAFTEYGHVVHYPSIHVLLPALMQSEQVMLSIQRRAHTLHQATQKDKQAFTLTPTYKLLIQSASDLLFFFFGPISGWRSEGRVFKEYDLRLVGGTGEPGGSESSDPRVHVYVRAGAP